MARWHIRCKWRGVILPYCLESKAPTEQPTQARNRKNRPLLGRSRQMDTKHTKPNGKSIPILFLDDELVSVSVLRQGSYTRNALEGPWRSSDPGAAVERARLGSYDLAPLLFVIVHIGIRVKRLLFSLKPYRVPGFLGGTQGRDKKHVNCIVG